MHNVPRGFVSVLIRTWDKRIQTSSIFGIRSHTPERQKRLFLELYGKGRESKCGLTGSGIKAADHRDGRRGSMMENRLPFPTWLST